MSVLSSPDIPVPFLLVDPPSAQTIVKQVYTLIQPNQDLHHRPLKFTISLIIQCQTYQRLALIWRQLKSRREYKILLSHRSQFCFHFLYFIQCMFQWTIIRNLHIVPSSKFITVYNILINKSVHHVCIISFGNYALNFA